MKKIAACLLSFSACLLMAPAASATWGGFISTGTATGIGNPSCAPVSAGHVACAVRSGKSVIMVNEFSGTKWGRGRAWPERSVLIRVVPAMEPAKYTALRPQPTAASRSQS